jgi:hypothetical protein
VGRARAPLAANADGSGRTSEDHKYTADHAAWCVWLSRVRFRGGTLGSVLKESPTWEDPRPSGGEEDSNRAQRPRWRGDDCRGGSLKLVSRLVVPLRAIAAAVEWDRRLGGNGGELVQHLGKQLEQRGPLGAA